MKSFFFPKSMVVIGASATKMNLGQIILLNNKQCGYQGKLYGVGSQAGEVDGIPVFTRIADIPEVPEVAIFLTPAHTIPTLMEDCGRKGIRRAVIESSGFSEYAHGDHSLEREVLAVANKYGIKFIGPNCVGTVNFDIRMMMPFAFFKNPPSGGRVAMIAQSGGVGGTYLHALPENAIVPGKFVSIGNKLQLDEVDFLEYFLADPETDVVTMYLEGFNRGRAFYELAVKADKPIIVQKSNRSEASAKIARSHTTALAAGDDVVDGMFRQTAVIRAEDEREFLNAVKIIRLPLMKGRRVAVLSRSGGHAVLSADACARFGFDMVAFPSAFLEKLKTLYHTRVIAHQNPLDLGEIFDYTIFTGILEETLKLENIDGVLFNHLYASTYEAQMSRTFLAGVDRLTREYGKPVAVAMLSDPAELLDVARSQSYPIFTSPLEAAAALNVSATYYERKGRRDHRGEVDPSPKNGGVLRTIRTQCRREGRMPLTDEALEICAAAGLTPVRGEIVRSGGDVNGLSLRFPVAVKLLSRQASHKTDVGGVRLNVRNRKALQRIMTEMERTFGDAAEGFLVQEMAAAGVECFVGGRQDPVFGPTVMTGLGGVFVELFRDTAIRLAPVTSAEAADMIGELQAYPLLAGFRGKSPADIEALKEVIRKVGVLLASRPEIAELDLNPVIVHPAGKGVSLVDARIFFK
ncbi:MAG: acetate--CoA ligase family protein [Syntrophobacterales bacterium]|nr:acetate--CoA ligase family protein [Syntrophobacterales bacterium]